MEYKVIWHDCEDDRTGESFAIKGISPVQAYRKAIDHIIGLSGYLKDHFIETDIETLTDKSGKPYLGRTLGQLLSKYEKDIKPEILKQVQKVPDFRNHNKSTFEQEISLDTILDRKMHYSETLFDDGGSNAHFVDYISDSRLYDLSDLLSGKNKEISLADHELKVAIPYRTVAKDAIKEFSEQGRNATHLVLYSEKYGGDDSSVWHEPFPIVIYELDEV